MFAAYVGQHVGLTQCVTDVPLLNLSGYIYIMKIVNQLKTT